MGDPIPAGEAARRFEVDLGGAEPPPVAICCDGSLSERELYFIVDGCPFPVAMSWAVLMSAAGGRALLMPDYLCKERHLDIEGRYYVRGKYLLAYLGDEDDGEGWRRHVKAALGPGINSFLEGACEAGGDEAAPDKSEICAALGWGPEFEEAATQLVAILAHLNA